jgi:hypothetical protein
MMMMSDDDGWWMVDGGWWMMMVGDGWRVSLRMEVAFMPQRACLANE